MTRSARARRVPARVILFLTLCLASIAAQLPAPPVDAHTAPPSKTHETNDRLPYLFKIGDMNLKTYELSYGYLAVGADIGWHGGWCPSYSEGTIGDLWVQHRWLDAGGNVVRWWSGYTKFSWGTWCANHNASEGDPPYHLRMQGPPIGSDVATVEVAVRYLTPYGVDWCPTCGTLVALDTTAVPPAPWNLRLRDVKSFNLELRWDDESSDETRFEIQKSEDGGATWADLGQVPADTTRYSYFPKALPASPLFRVRAIRGAGGTPTRWSNVAGVRLAPPSRSDSAWWEPTRTMTSGVAFGDPQLRLQDGAAHWLLSWRDPDAWDVALQTQARPLDSFGSPTASWSNVGSSFNCGSGACANPSSQTWAPAAAPEHVEIRVVSAVDHDRVFLKARTYDGEPTYVAMGDSYASGEGIPPYVLGSDGEGCHRSTLSWMTGLSIQSVGDRFIACSGAKIQNVVPVDDPSMYPRGVSHRGEPAQLDQGVVSDETDLVTISIGGNDLGWSGIMQDCAWAEECTSPDYRPFDGVPFMEWLSAEVDEMYWPLRHAYSAVRRASPHTRIVVTGYPQLFGDHPWQTGDSCTKVSAAGFSAGEQELFRYAGARFNGVISTASQDGGAEFADVAEMFAGREICGIPEWINYYVVPDPVTGGEKMDEASFHPNLEGQAGYVAAVNDVLDGAPPTSPRDAFDGQLPRRDELGDPNPGSFGVLAADCDEELVRFSGEGYRGSTPVRLSIELRDGTRRRGGTVTTRPGGALSGAIRVPAEAEPQQAIVRAVGRGADAGKRIAVGLVRVGAGC